MKKILVALRRFFNTNSAEKVFFPHTREIHEAIERKNEVMYWLYDISRYTINK